MKRTLIHLFILSVSLFSQEYQDFKFLHPRSQPNLLRRIDMIDANNWFAVGANGTFMRTTNGGVNWYFHHYAGRVGAAYDVSQNYHVWFLNTNTGIVAGDKGYIGRTTNAGTTFDSVALGLIPLNQRSQGIWFFDQNTGFVCAGSASGYGGTIVKTSNGGLSWTSVYTTSSTAITSVSGTDAQTVIALQTNGTILKTTNGGSNWSESAVVMGQFMYDISFLNSSTGIVCGGAGKIYRTTNGGTSWDSVGSGQSNWSLFQVKIVSASEIYAVGDPGFLYKSTDGGSTWLSLPIAVTGPSTTFIWYSIDKIGSTLIMTGDYGIIAKSTDGGVTWSSNNFLLSTSLLYDVQTIPGSPKVWVVGRGLNLGTTRQIFYSSNSGENWTTYDLGLSGDFYSISMLNQLTGYVSGQNSRVLKTTNGGQNWVMKTQPSGSNYSLYSMEFVNENTGWVFVNYTTVPGGNVFKTTNGGDNWTQYTTGGTSENIYSADMADANTGYCCYNPSNKPVYKTTNGGENWTALTTGLTGSIRDVKAVTADIVYVGQTSGTQRLAKTTNGGLNWTLITLPVAVDVTSIDFKDANTGYVCGNSTTAICRTTDGGNSWSFQNAHNITLIKIYVNSGDTVYTLGGNAAIMRASGSAITSVHYEPNEIPGSYILKQNYPNPFNPSTRIEFSLPEASLVSVRIFDITGKEYESQIQSLQLNAGTFKYDFDGSKISSGVYFYSIFVNGQRIDTKKMILVK